MESEAMNAMHHAQCQKCTKYHFPFSPFLARNFFQFCETSGGKSMQVYKNKKQNFSKVFVSYYQRENCAFESNVNAGGENNSPLTLLSSALLVCWSSLFRRKCQSLHLLSLLLMVETNGSNFMLQDHKVPPGKFATLGTFRLPQALRAICLVSNVYLVPWFRRACLHIHPPPSQWASFLAAERETTLTTQCTKSLLKKELLGERHFDSVEWKGCFCPVVLGLGNNCQAHPTNYL